MGKARGSHAQLNELFPGLLVLDIVSLLQHFSSMSISALTFGFRPCVYLSLTFCPFTIAFCLFVIVCISPLTAVML